MKPDLLIPSKVRFIYTQITEEKSRFFNKNVGFFVDIKSTKSSIDKVKKDISECFRLNLDNIKFEEINLNNSKLKISIIPNMLSLGIYNYRIRTSIYPFYVKSCDFPEDKEFISFSLMFTILNAISEVGNIVRREIAGNFCISQEDNINFFGKLIYEDLNNKDLLKAKKLGSTRDNEGNTTKWLPGNIYLYGKKFYLYLGEVSGKLLYSQSSSTNINICYNSTIGAYSDVYIKDNFGIYLVSNSLDNLPKESLMNYMKLHFFDDIKNKCSTKNYNIIIRSSDCSKISGIDCNTNIKLDKKFDISYFIKSESKKLVLESFKKGEYLDNILTLVPELINEDELILKEFLNKRIESYKNWWGKRCNTFREFCDKYPNKVNDLFNKNWINIYNKDQIIDYCEKIFKK